MSASWISQLQPASWRGVHFSVRRSDVTAGRKTAVHQYPFQDTAWVEDLGKRPRSFSFQGFLVGDNCYVQEKAMHAAANVAGPGLLVHPTFGTIVCSLISFSTGQETETGRTVSINFTFIEGAPSPLYPSSSVSTQNLTKNACGLLSLASAQAFFNQILAPIQYGAEVFNSITASIENFADLCSTAIQDAGLIAGAVAQLIPPEFFTYGRYAAGDLIGLNPNITTVEGVLSAVTTAQTAVSEAATVAINSEATNSADIALNVQALVQAVQNAAVDPADQVRLLTTLAAYTPTEIMTVAPIGSAIDQVQAATSALCRQAALACLGLASAATNLSSSNQAIDLRNQLAALFDAEILVAGDIDDIVSYQALRQVRTAIVLDLNTRAADLPALKTVETTVSLPALTIAYQLYSDATRCDDLIARADPLNPLFMPVSFVALSA